MFRFIDVTNLMADYDAGVPSPWRRQSQTAGVWNVEHVHEQCLDQGIFRHLTRRNPAALAAELADAASAERLWRDVLAECPWDHEALAQLERLRHGAGTCVVRREATRIDALSGDRKDRRGTRAQMKS